MTWTILPEVIFILFAITVVFLTSTRSRVPTVSRIDSPTSQPPVPAGAFERQLQGRDFRFAGEYDATMTARTPTRLRIYQAPDDLCTACLIEIKMATDRVQILECHTDLSPAGSITTSTSSHPRIFAYPPGKVLAKVPWKRTVAEVLELHSALCSAAQMEGFKPQYLPRSNFADLIQQDTRLDLDYQVKHKLVKKLDPDQYKLTLLGCLVATPLVWFNMTYGFLFSWYRPGNETFCRRLRRRLKRAKSGVSA